MGERSQRTWQEDQRTHPGALSATLWTISHRPGTDSLTVTVRNPAHSVAIQSPQSQRQRRHDSATYQPDLAPVPGSSPILGSGQFALGLPARSAVYALAARMRCAARRAAPETVSEPRPA